MRKLTKTLVDDLKAGVADRFVWDGEMPRFGVRVYPPSRTSPQGKKVFVVQYRNAETVTKRVNVGVYGPTLTVDQARKKAKEMLIRVDRGEDIAATRDERRHGMTVAELCAEWLRSGWNRPRKGKRGPLKASSLYIYKSAIERHILPLIGTRRVTALTAKDFRDMLEAIVEGRTACVVVEVMWSNSAAVGHQGSRTITVPWRADVGGRLPSPSEVAKRVLASERLPAASHPKAAVRAAVAGGTGIGSRVVAYASSIMAYAVKQEYLETNPVLGVETYPTREVGRYLDADGLRRLAGSLEEEHRHGGNPFTIAALWLLALTGRREGEVLGLRWDEVHLDRRALRLRDSKTGPMSLPLSSAAITLLGSMPRLADAPFVFPSATSMSGHLQEIGHLWKRVRANAKLTGFRLHDLRHTQASVGVASGLTLHLVGAVLGHRRASTTERYAHLDLTPQQAAAETIGGVLTGHMGGWRFEGRVEEAPETLITTASGDGHPAAGPVAGQDRADGGQGAGDLLP